MNALIYVRFGSHRAREYGLRALAQLPDARKPESFFSLKRETGPGGVYAVTETEITAMRSYSRHARFTRLKGPHGDLMPCWEQH